jgi:tagatose 6-phosphate kinase
MIHFVNMNATWDTVLLCDAVKDGDVNRAKSVLSYPGGKGNNAARSAALLGAKPIIYSFCGAEDQGDVRKFYAARGIKANLFPAPGRNRPCVILLDAARNRETVINSPSQIRLGAAHLAALKKKLLAALQPGDLVALSGSLPEGVKPGAYRELVLAVQAAGAVALMDAYGPALEHGVKAAPFLVKPNAAELAETFGWRLNTRTQILSAADRLLKMGVRVVVVTLGDRGALCKTRRESLYVAPLPRPRGWNSSVGCGDAFFGALALGMDRGMELKDCLRLATASAWANLQAPGAVFFDKRLALGQVSQVRVSRVDLG